MCYRTILGYTISLKCAFIDTKQTCMHEHRNTEKLSLRVDVSNSIRLLQVVIPLAYTSELALQQMNYRTTKLVFA